MLEQSIGHVQKDMLFSAYGSFCIYIYFATDVYVYVKLCLWNLIA